MTLSQSPNIPQAPPTSPTPQEGKRAADLASALPPHLKRSLMYVVESVGLPK